MITRSKRTVTKVVTVMGDPEPEFVSIVGRGANQTPFKKTKIDQPMSTRTKPTTPTKVEKAEGDKPEMELQKMVFPGDKFKDEAAVTAYLEKKEYSNFIVEKVGEDFVVESLPEDQFESVAPIVKADGVTMFVGKLTDDAAQALKGDVTINIRQIEKLPGEDKKVIDPQAAAKEGEQAAKGEDEDKGEGKGEEEKPTDPPAVTTKGEDSAPAVRSRTRRSAFLSIKDDRLNAQKIDCYDAYYSNEDTIAGVLEDAADGLPVGFSDVQVAFVGAFRNIVLTEKVDQIPTLTAEFGAILQKLATLTTAVAKEDREKALNSFLGIAETETPAKKSDEKPTTTLETAAPGLGLSEGIESAVSKALEPVLAEVKKMASRVTRIERIRQTPKGAALEDVMTAGEETQTQKKDEERPAALKKADANLWGR